MSFSQEERGLGDSGLRPVLSKLARYTTETESANFETSPDGKRIQQRTLWRGEIPLMKLHYQIRLNGFWLRAMIMAHPRSSHQQLIDVLKLLVEICAPEHLVEHINVRSNWEQETGLAAETRSGDHGSWNSPDCIFLAASSLVWAYV